MAFREPHGILAKIPGSLIAQGSQSLRQPVAGAPEQMHAEVDVPDIGRVRITYRLSSSSHHKSRKWFWTAKFAGVVR